MRTSKKTTNIQMHRRLMPGSILWLVSSIDCMANAFSLVLAPPIIANNKCVGARRGRAECDIETNACGM